MRLAITPELITAALDPNRDGMERLLEMLWPHAFRIALSILQNKTLAEDAAQEACALIYGRLSQLRDPKAFHAWAYRIVTHEAFRIAERTVPCTTISEPTYELDVDERVDVLRALAQLPTDLRAVIVLHHYAQLSSSEIAVVFGIPSPTVRFRLSRGRKLLQRLLTVESGTAAFLEVSQ
jgi:RNA polymerase sigma-70 factor, ECF subfamily